MEKEFIVGPLMNWREFAMMMQNIQDGKVTREMTTDIVDRLRATHREWSDADAVGCRDCGTNYEPCISQKAADEIERLLRLVSQAADKMKQLSEENERLRALCEIPAGMKVE